jgi:hypothetical protein
VVLHKGSVWEVAIVWLTVRFGSVWVTCCWSSPAQTFLVPGPVGLMTIFFCLTTLWLSVCRDTALHRPRQLHTLSSHSAPHDPCIRQSALSNLRICISFVYPSIMVLWSTMLGLTDTGVVGSDHGRVLYICTCILIFHPRNPTAFLNRELENLYKRQG